MVLRVLGVLALVIGAIFAAVMLLVLLPFLDNFNMSLLILAGVFGVLAYVFLAIGWQLFHPPDRSGIRADESPAEGDDEAHLVPTAEAAIGLTSGAKALAEGAHQPVEPVVGVVNPAPVPVAEAGIVLAVEPAPVVAEPAAAQVEPAAAQVEPEPERVLEPEAELEPELEPEPELVYAGVDSPSGLEVGAAPSEPALVPPRTPESILPPEPVVESSPTPEPAPAPPEPAPAPSVLVVDEVADDGTPPDGDSKQLPTDGAHPSGHRIPDRRARSTFKKKGAALPRR